MAEYLDFQLDNDGDFLIVAGSFPIIEDSIVLKQQVETNLKLAKKDWFLNFDEGMTFFDNKDGIFGAKEITPTMEAEFQTAVLSINGIESIIDFSYEFTDNSLNVKMTLLTSFGEEKVNTTI
jgi:hypothetical protein